MHIKSWNQLCKDEQFQAKDFFTYHGQSFVPQSRDERAKFLLGHVFGYGENLFFAINDSRIVGSLGCVLLEIKVKGVAYITEVNILKEFANHEIVNLLLDAGFGECRKSQAKTIYIGVKPSVDFIEKNLLLSGLEKSYHHIELIKEEKEIYDISAKCYMLSLSKDTLKEYAVIMTDAFLTSPNGATVTVNDALEILKDSRKSAGLLWEMEANQPVGAFEATVIDDTGWLDALAIAPNYQTLGYGKQLFRLVQNLLWRKEVSILKMTVMDINRNAFEMYLKHGFKLHKSLSTWYRKNLV